LAWTDHDHISRAFWTFSPSAVLSPWHVMHVAVSDAAVTVVPGADVADDVAAALAGAVEALVPGPPASGVQASIPIPSVAAAASVYCVVFLSIRLLPAWLK
jgi:hypothetical protein